MIERWEPVWRTLLPRMHCKRFSGKLSPTVAWASEPCLSLHLSLVWGLCWLCPALPSALPAVVFPVVRRANWVNHCDLADIHRELRSARLILCVSRAKISTWWKAVEFISQSVAQTLPFLSPTALVLRRLPKAPHYSIFAVSSNTCVQCRSWVVTEPGSGNFFSSWLGKSQGAWPCFHAWTENPKGWPFLLTLNLNPEKYL